MPRSRSSRILISLPDRIPLIALAAFLVISVTTTYGIFYEWLVLPAIVVVAVGLWFLVPASTVAHSRAARWGTIAALVVAVVWLAGNAPFVAQWFDPGRDPGIYFDHGLWFANHPGSAISIIRGTNLTAGIPGLTHELGSIRGGPLSLVTPQGGDLLPGVIAAATWLGGFIGATEANLVLGTIGLIGLYGLARRLLGPLWALVPQIALGMSMAYIYLSRGPFSEIIMVIVGLAALTWLISGVRSGAWRDFVIAGLFTGVATSARIDGVLVGAGALLVLAIAAFGFVSPRKQRPIVVGGAVFAALAAGSSWFGVFALLRNKSVYVHALGDQPVLLWLATGAIAAIFVLFWLVSFALRLDSRRMTMFWWRAAPVLSGVVLAILVFWLSRPLWYVGHFAGSGGAATISALQGEENLLPLDGTRSYEEQTMSWLGWYFGWPMVGLAIIGLTLMVWHGVRRKNLPLLMAAIAPLTVAAVYFTDVAITPDQIWAFRRILPVITPGFLIAATYAVALVWRRFRSRWIRVVAIALAACVALGPVVTWNGLLLVQYAGNQLSGTEAMCKSIGDAKEVLMIADGATGNYGFTIKTACDVDVITVVSTDIKDGNLAALHKRTGDIPVIGWNQAAMPEPRRSTSADLGYIVPRWNRHINHLPDAIVSTDIALYFGTLKADGSVVPQ